MMMADRDVPSTPKTVPAPILPGAALGVLGSGQLGRMFAIAARRLGYRVHVLSPDDDTPAGQVADVEFRADYLDLDTVRRFARSVEVVTYEFENVPSETSAAAAEAVPVRPLGRVLHITQQRLREKGFLHEQGLAVTPFRPIHSLADLERAASELGLPAVLKTASWGYDGKGQIVVRSASELSNAWASLKTDAAILEQLVDFTAELSVVVARGVSGQCVTYGPIWNTHSRHILDLSVCPAPFPEPIQQAAIALALNTARALDVVGILCVEMFLTRDGQLLINECAPRPHNSGHLTIDAHVSCQFEQQVRAVAGLPLGSARQRQPAAMANLLGDLWSAGEPDWARLCSFPEVKLHLYGKREARPGRKMGHLTALADSPEAARELAIAARAALLR